MKRITIALAVVLLSVVIALSGCSSQKENGYAVRVNDQDISMETYQGKLDAVKVYLKQQGLDFDGEQGKQTLESVKQDVLEGLISTELIKLEIKKTGWDANDPAVTQQIEDLKAQIPGQDFQGWLKEQDMTEEEVKDYFTFTYFVSKDVTVTDEEVKQFFDIYYANYGGQQEQVKARHILLETEEEAYQVIAEIKAGADFAELAKEKSIEGAAVSTGGDLGYFTRGRMVPEFEQAAFSQEENVVSAEPVKSQFGYHVILVEDHKPGVKPSFDTAKDLVEKDALDYAKQQTVQSYYSVLRQKAKVEYGEGIKPNIA